VLSRHTKTLKKSQTNFKANTILIVIDGDPAKTNCLIAPIGFADCTDVLSA